MKTIPTYSMAIIPPAPAFVSQSQQAQYAVPQEISRNTLKPQPLFPCEEHPVAVYIASLQSPLSRSTMQEVLHGLAQRMSGGQSDEWSYSWVSLRFQHVNALKSLLLETQSYVTVNKKLSAVRGVLKAAWRLEQMDSETYHRSVDVRSAKGSTLPRGREVGAKEFVNLFAVCADPRAGNAVAASRDAAIFAVMYAGAGPRRSEVVGFDLTDYDAETGALAIRAGKGNKSRMGYLSATHRIAVNAWIVQRGDTPGPLFCPIHKGGKIVREIDGSPQRMTPYGIGWIVGKRTQQAGMKATTPHDFRRNAATEMSSLGVDLPTIKDSLGHESILTTERYVLTNEKKKKRAANLLSIPYVAYGE